MSNLENLISKAKRIQIKYNILNEQLILCKQGYNYAYDTGHETDQQIFQDQIEQYRVQAENICYQLVKTHSEIAAEYHTRQNYNAAIENYHYALAQLEHVAATAECLDLRTELYNSLFRVHVDVATDPFCDDRDAELLKIIKLKEDLFQLQIDRGHLHSALITSLHIDEIKLGVSYLTEDERVALINSCIKKIDDINDLTIHSDNDNMFLRMIRDRSFEIAKYSLLYNGSTFDTCINKMWAAATKISPQIYEDKIANIKAWELLAERAIQISAPLKAMSAYNLALEFANETTLRDEDLEFVNSISTKAYQLSSSLNIPTTSSAAKVAHARMKLSTPIANAERTYYESIIQISGTSLQASNDVVLFASPGSDRNSVDNAHNKTPRQVIDLTSSNKRRRL